MNKRALKMFARLDGQKRIVSNSNIWRQKKPLVGNWVEIPGYLCCNVPTYTCTSYSIILSRDATGTYTYTPCGSTQAVGPVEITGPQVIVVCAVTDSFSYTGSIKASALGECQTTTTTTSTTSTSTTSTSTSTTTSTTTSHS